LMFFVRDKNVLKAKPERNDAITTNSIKEVFFMLLGWIVIYI